MSARRAVWFAWKLERTVSREGAKKSGTGPEGCGPINRSALTGKVPSRVDTELSPFRLAFTRILAATGRLWTSSRILLAGVAATAMRRLAPFADFSAARDWRYSMRWSGEILFPLSFSRKAVLSCIVFGQSRNNQCMGVDVTRMYR